MPASIPREDLPIPPISSLSWPARLRTRRSRKLLLLALGTVMIVLVVSRQPVWRDLAYIFRPLCDTAPKPFTVIPHYDHPNISASSLCALHSWEPRKERARVWDATIFSVELDLLEIRMRELYNVVDYFIIVESNTTFTGNPKPLLFAQHRDDPEFSWASDKILYRALPLPSHIAGLTHAEATWWNERRSRREINDVMQSRGAKPGDLLIQADVDEIPSGRTIDLLRSCRGYPDVLHLQLRSFMYSFTRSIPDTEGGGSWSASVKTWNPDGQGYTGYAHGRQSDAILSDAGWHCSWCFRFLEDFRFKMTSYSHFDRVTHPERQLNIEEIQKKVCSGRDLFDMLPEAYTFRDLAKLSGPYTIEKSFIYLPWWSIQNPERFAYLLRQENCTRMDGLHI